MNDRLGKVVSSLEMAEAFKQSGTLFRVLIENSSDILAFLTEKCTFFSISANVQDLLGFTAGELNGSSIFELVPLQHRTQVRQQFEKALNTPGVTRCFEHPYTHKDGSLRWVENSITNLLNDPTVCAIISNLHDITRRKHADERFQLLNAVSALLTDSLNQQITLQQITNLLVPTLADYCRIALVVNEGEQQHQEIGATHVDPEKLALVQSLYEQYKDRESTTHGLQKLLETGQPELISIVSDDVLESVADNPELHHTVQNLHLRSYMGVPLIARERVIGAITLSSVQPSRHYGPDDLAFAQELAHRLALTIDNVRLYQNAQDELAERKQVEVRLRFLSDASKQLASSLDYQTTLANITNLAVPHIADWCSVDILTEEGLQQLAVAHIDPEKVRWAQELRQKSPPDLSSPTGLSRVLRTGEPEFYPEMNDEFLQATADDEEELALLRYIGFTSAMIVPLLTRGNTLGAITFVTAESGRHFTATDLSMAEELASRAALAVENSHLYTEAQNAIRVRDDFISIASHELKTPVTSLKMFAQVLQKQLARMGEERLSRSLARMDAQLNKLTLLIGDLLSVSKLELGQLDLQNEVFDLSEVVNEIVEQIQLTTKHTISIEADEPAQAIWGDKDRLGQALTNLLSNAVKYSPNADTIIVRVGLEENMAIIRVQDFGIGISEEHLTNIFTRFYRVNDSEERTFPGLGIGLYLSHEIVKRHGGTLSVVSQKGQGSIFRLAVPCAQSEVPIKS